MTIAQSRITAQGQISIPSEVRKKLGVGPGSILEWDDSENQVVVRRAGRSSSEDVFQALFPSGKPSSLGDLKEGIRKHMRSKHARD
jgi:AbrB family looped-hinge helix DNA binding protein